MPTYQVDKIAVLADDDNASLPRGVENFSIGGIPHAEVAEGNGLYAMLLRQPRRQRGW